MFSTTCRAGALIALTIACFAAAPRGLTKNADADPNKKDIEPPKPVFESEAQLLLVRKQVDQTLPQLDPARVWFDDDLASHLALIKSYAIVHRALKKPQLQDLKSVPRENAEEFVMNGLTARRDPSGAKNIFLVSYRGPNMQENRDILSAVTDAYQMFLDETTKSVNDRQLELLLESKRALTDRQAAMEQSLVDLIRKAGATGSAEQRDALRQARVAALDARKTSLLASRTELQGQLSWLDKAVAEKRDQTAIRLRIKEWANRSGFGDLQAQPGQNADTIPTYRELLKQRLEENLAIEKELDQMLEAEREKSLTDAPLRMAEDQARHNIAQTRELLDGMTKRLIQINMVRAFDGMEIRRVSPPRTKKIG